jgi:hypothetical protein
MTQTPTVPASFESAVFIPPSARLSALAMAALENGVSGDDVLAYLSSRYAARPLSVEIVQVSR